MCTCLYLILLYSLFRQADTSGDNALSFDEFEQSLKEMDKNLTQLPPTAQVIFVLHLLQHIATNTDDVIVVFSVHVANHFALNFNTPVTYRYRRTPFFKGYKFREKGKSTISWKLFSR